MSELQLEMSFDRSQNDLKKSIDSGEFVFLAECRIPEEEKNLKSAVDRIMPYAEKMWAFEDLHGGLAFTDNNIVPWSPVEFASALPNEKRNRNLFYLSGSGRGPEEYRNELTVAAGADCRNIVAVSGDALPMTVRECRKREFISSVEALKLLGESGKFNPGAVFNPFQYRGETVAGSYGNLEKKLASGAEYIIVQAGWDMLQLQTLSWYMLNNAHYYPMIARLVLLTPEKVEKIVSGKVPGVRITREFNKLLSRELSGSRAQFETAQYRRLEIQAAGCRLMGFSGVQVCGVDFPGKAAVIADRLRSAMKEFRSFEQWLDQYNALQAGSEMNLNLHSYHLYDRVLRRPYPQDEPPTGTDPGEPQVSLREKLGFYIKRAMFARADQVSAGRDRLLKKLFASCRSCSKCTLPQHDFICPGTCPKGLKFGPCGGVQIDGKCEIGDSECVFLKIDRISHWRNRRNRRKNLE